MDIRFMGAITTYRIANQNLLHIIVPKKTIEFYGLTYTYLRKADNKIDYKGTSLANRTEVFVTLSTKEEYDKNNIIEAEEVDRIVAMQRKGEIIDKKLRIKLRKTFETAKSIHDEALKNPNFQEPSWVMALFATPDALDAAIERVVKKAMLEKEGKNG